MSEDKFYTVYSKFPSASEWSIERTYGVECYAKDMAKALKKLGKQVKIKIK